QRIQRPDVVLMRMRQQQPRNRLVRNRTRCVDHAPRATRYSRIDQREAIALANEIAVDQPKLGQLMAIRRDFMNLHIATPYRNPISQLWMPSRIHPLQPTRYNGSVQSHGQPSAAMQSILKLSLALTFLYILATFIFGLRAHSLALLSEAGHNVSDFLALALSFFAVYLQTRPATDERTFGYQRAGVLAGFVNALTLIALSVWLVIAAIHRFTAPVAVHADMMMVVAATGVVMNGAIAALLWKFSGDVNIRSVFLHMLGDTISTAAVIVGGLLIRVTGLEWIDPLLSLLIAAVILW